MKCIECKRLQKIENTDESRQGLCTYSIGYVPVCVDNECMYIPKPLTCKDCSRFGEDYACFTAVEDEPVVDEKGHWCAGYLDKNEEAVYNALADWSLRGYDAQAKLKAVFEEFEGQFQAPFQPMD